MKTNSKFFTLREVENLMARRYEVTRNFGPMEEGDRGSIVDVRQQGEDGYWLIFRAPKRSDHSAYKHFSLTPREMLFLREIEVNAPIDALVTMGEEFWRSPEAVIEEIRQMGFSHRIPANFDATRVKRGISRAFLGHNRAVMQVGKGTYDAVLAYLAGVADREVQKIVKRKYTHEPSRVLDLPTAIRNKVCRKFQIAFAYGIFGYVYVSGCSYYLKKNEVETPTEMLKRGYKGVRVTHIAQKAVIEQETAEQSE